jgi:hypothetical protein
VGATVADTHIGALIDQLRQHLPHVPPVAARKLKALHKSGDYEGMVRLIRSAMNLDVRLLVGWVNSGGAKEMSRAPAWVEMPTNMPFYGTPEFKKLSVRMFIRKEFLENSSYDKVAIAIAHELSHIVLDSIHHPLREEEKAVDLAAMLLGFSRLYMRGAHTTTSKLGYLTPSELAAAARILVPIRFRIARAAFVVVQSSPRLVVALLLLLSMWTSEKINSKVELHKRLQSEAHSIPIPTTLNSYMTLVGAQATLFSLTKAYLVTQPTRLDLANREQRVRNAVCSKKRMNIDAGAVYLYEYREPSGSLIGRFEVSSCP